MTNLTVKQEAFCQHYALNGNASEAYRQAYDAENMKPESINRKAFDLTENVKIRARIEELRNEVKERFIVTAEEKKRLLWEIATYGSETFVKIPKGEYEELIEKQRDPKATVAAIRELNMMDGDHSAIKQKHEVEMTSPIVELPANNRRAKKD